MKDFIVKTSESFMYWKLAWFKAGLLAFISFQAALQAGTANVAWGNLDSFEKCMVLLSSLAASATALSGFLDRTMSRLESEKPNQEKETKP